MGDYVHRTTKQHLVSVSAASLPEPLANYIDGPDLTAVAGFEARYWIITGDVITLMDQSARDAVDAAELSARLDGLADEIDNAQTYSRAFAEVVLDEFNAHALRINAILDAIDAASNLGQVKTAVAAIADYPPRTLSQLKTAVRSKL